MSSISISSAFNKLLLVQRRLHVNKVAVMDACTVSCIGDLSQFPLTVNQIAPLQLTLNSNFWLHRGPVWVYCSVAITAGLWCSQLWAKPPTESLLNMSYSCLPIHTNWVALQQHNCSFKLNKFLAPNLKAFLMSTIHRYWIITLIENFWCVHCGFVTVAIGIYISAAL